MPDSIDIRFRSGNTVRFGAGPGLPGSGGLAEVGLTDAVVGQAEDTFNRAMDALGDVVRRIETAIAALEHRPDGVSVEFGASLTGKCDLWVVSGDGAAEFKVTLNWGKNDG